LLANVSQSPAIGMMLSSVCLSVRDAGHCGQMTHDRIISYCLDLPWHPHPSLIADWPPGRVSEKLLFQQSTKGFSVDSQPAVCCPQ